MHRVDTKVARVLGQSHTRREGLIPAAPLLQGARQKLSVRVRKVSRLEIRNDIGLVIGAAIVGKLAAEGEPPAAIDADSLPGECFAASSRKIIRGRCRK